MMDRMLPELRFPGFAGEWVKSQIAQISDLVTSGSRDWARFYSDTGSKFIRMTNLPKTGVRLLMNDMKYVKLPEVGHEGARTALQANDLLISITAELGKIGIIPKGFGEAYINQHTALVRIKEISSYPLFIAYLLSTKRTNKRLNRLNDSGAKAGLNLKTINRFSIRIPGVDEQQKIADFLTAVDNKLTVLRRKRELLQTYKLGMMQKLFSQDLRFAAHGCANAASSGRAGAAKAEDDSEFPEWEEKRFGDCIQSLDAGVSVNSADRPAHQGEKGILKTSAVTSGKYVPTENKLVHSSKELARLKEPVRANTIIISRMNTPALVGASGFVNKDNPNLFLPDRLWSIKVKNGCSCRWLSILLASDKMRVALSARATGTSGSMKNITKSDVLSIKIMCPSLSEQKNSQLPFRLRRQDRHRGPTDRPHGDLQEKVCCKRCSSSPQFACMT